MMRIKSDICSICRRLRQFSAIIFCCFLLKFADGQDFPIEDYDENTLFHEHFSQKQQPKSIPKYKLTDIDLICQSGWELHSANCYRLYEIERSWPQALVVCGRYGSQLVRIESYSENDFVYRLIRRQEQRGVNVDTSHWIGLITQQMQGIDPLFLWSDGSIVSRYAGYWAHGQPNYANGSCTVGSTRSSSSSSSSSSSATFQWSLEMCNLLLPFVCQMPACVRGSHLCLNGRCVPENAHCDGVDDCGDYSDELNCPAVLESASCLKFERGQSGSMQSPNYPSSYPVDANCRWTLEGPLGSRIHMKFDYFETEEHADVVHLLDGGPAENTSAVIATLSGEINSRQLMFTSSTNMLTVRFRSDSSIQARGFQASWRAMTIACGGLLKALPYGQTFTSPDYPDPYPNGLECVWKLQAPRGDVITLDMKDIMLEPNKDFLIVYDGDSPAAAVLLRFSGLFTGSQLLISSQNHLYVHFYTNYAVAGRGFTINYKRGCDNVIRQSHGTLLSPGHTQVAYPGSKTCSYTIDVPDNKAQPVALSVNLFDVLDEDYLQIFDGVDAQSTPLHTGKGFGGSNRPPSHVVSRKGKLHLVFSTDPVHGGRGWNITFSTNCPPLDIPREVSLSTGSTGFGTKLTVACPRGHEFITGQGQQYQLECQLGGVWSASRVPSCQPMYCAPVPQIQNGFAMFAANVTYGGSASYRCYEGFHFPDRRQTQEIYCTDEGRWTPTVSCKAQTCPALPPFKHGERKLQFGDGTGYGTVYRLDCVPGYRREGPPALLCRTDGQWSSKQPVCKKLRCYTVPIVDHGSVLNPTREYLFGHTTRVVCRPGYIPRGPDQIRCLANQSFSETPQCLDVDECEDRSADCAPESTVCVNLPGGYRCDCLPGYKAQLECTIAASLGVSTDSALATRLHSSSSVPQFPASSLGTVGWCAAIADRHGVSWIRIEFDEPKIVHRIRLEKIGVDRGSYVTSFSLGISEHSGAPPVPYADRNTTKYLMNGNVNGGLPSEVIVLPRSMEALSVTFYIEDYHGAPCARLELFGCRKAICTDIDECQVNNGHCDQLCVNSPGSYHCNCGDGFDLFVENGQGGLYLKQDEDGMRQLDVHRFNKSCIARTCPSLERPEHGSMLTIGNVVHLHPNVVEFQCRFGHQMIGDSRLQCLADGTWNGSVPLCIPATCQGLHNNSAIGLFVIPDNNTIGYGQNVTVLCTQQNRPPRRSEFASFRQCIYDPRPDGRSYWLAGQDVDCSLVNCGRPIALAGTIYDGLDLDDSRSYTVGNSFQFGCRPPYVRSGSSRFDDRTVRCQVDGSWDFGDLRCDGPVCVDPGHPSDGSVTLDSIEEGAVARFSCSRPGYRPFPTDSIHCVLGAPCVLSEEVGITSGFVPDGAFADNSDRTVWGFEPHKARMSSSGWCGHKDAFIFLSVDLQRIYTLTTLRLAGVAGSGHLRGHITKMQLFYKVQFRQNYDTYPLEFQTSPGNHSAMRQFRLDPPLRARYILLGVTEYDGNPCIRFDLHGCVAPLTIVQEVPLNLQVGWNTSTPDCVDVQPPTFANCPANPVYVLTDEQGQLMPAKFDPPQANDNSGYVWIRVEPEEFAPPQFITQDVDVIYTAFDVAGNTAECVIKLRIPDTLPPVMQCPDSHVVELTDEALEYLLIFNETTVNVVVQDTSNIAELTFDPSFAVIPLNGHVTVTVRAMDDLGNRNKCRFQVVLRGRAAPCAEWSLPDPEHGSKVCTRSPGDTGVYCTVQCLPGYQFVDGAKLNKRFTCSQNGPWSPSPVVPACVPIAQEPARYELTVSVIYPVRTPVGHDCLRGYTDFVATYFDRLDAVLSQRCSGSIKVFVRFLGAKFFSFNDNVTANYTMQILPSVLQDVFYQLCGLTLRTIVDLRIPGVTVPVSPLLSIPGETVATEGVGCPSINASATHVHQGFGCIAGEVLRDTETLPECLPCSAGTVYVNNSCLSCPLGTFQDQAGQTTCKSCPEGFFTLYNGTHRQEDCLPVCGNGMYGDTGMIPCQLCPRHSYSGPAVRGGAKSCDSCPQSSYTAKLGATGPSQCRLPCDPGHFSVTGLRPCSPCPIDFFQPSLGQQRCIECPNDTATNKPGGAMPHDCVSVDCQSVHCENKGECEVVHHRSRCKCLPGYEGPLCERNVDLCASDPCFNNAQCQNIGGDFRCICPQNFTGDRCQFGPDECIGMHCPNGGVCVDLPGLGTKRCVCRTGFTGPDCSQIVDPCHRGDHPCMNGADCLPLQLGRFKCKCLPGWTGVVCDQNIDDCVEKPCALNSTCKDLVNDFECDCPSGFTGKRCHLKRDLCADDPCVHGICVDRLFQRQCLCQPGWTGVFCEENIDECASSPCLNGASCRDSDADFTCMCPPGYLGSRCQHLVDHCQSSPCRNEAECENRGATYRCRCRLGFEGTHCEHNVNECEREDVCAEGAQSCRDLIDRFECRCRPGFKGLRCEEEINECDTDPCLNNGTCVDGMAQFSCRCSPGWTGQRCEEETGGCERSPCQNDGVCVNLVADYFCVCSSGVDGKNCQVAPNRCIGEPCHNGGVCGDFGSRLECTCPKDYVGVGCQYELDACNAGICENGAKCTDLEKGYQCDCPAGFMGTNCETNMDDCSPSPCPLAATCIDQVNGHFCQCPFNMTGGNCDKVVSTNYDIRFYDSVLPAQAAMSVPFPFKAEHLTIALWLRFETPGQRGTVLTLYSSRESNYPSRLKELLRVTSEGVRVELFDTETALSLQFPPSQPVDNGDWNHVVFVWSADDGSFSLILNAVRIFGDDGYGVGKVVDIDAWMTLGYPVSETPNEPKFVGSVSRVNMWTRALSFGREIPSIVQGCQTAPVLFDGLVLRWTGYNRLSGKDCSLSPSNGRCSVDRMPPNADFCPGDVYVATSLKEVNVTWREPHFHDDVMIDRVEHNLKPGQVFTWGDYLVLYVAYDNSSNFAQCHFKVHVTRDFCPELQDPVHGLQTCEHWGPDLRYTCSSQILRNASVSSFMACSVECDPNFSFSRPSPVFYSCGTEGVWRPRPPRTLVFHYPQCSRSLPAARIIDVKLDYPTTVLCNRAGRRTLTARLIDMIGAINRQWNLCIRTNADGKCQGVNVTVMCIMNKEKRRVRRKSTEEVYSARIHLPAKRDPLISADTERSSTVLEVLQSAILLDDSFNFEQILPNGRPDLNSFRLDDIYSCSEGFVTVDDVCVPCSPGSFFTNNRCDLCPIGQYQPKSNQLTCLSCSPNFTTAGPGAIALSDCKVSCANGRYYDRQSNSCTDCGFGFYQPDAGHFSCSPCGIGKTTLTTTTVSRDDCRDECPDGQHLIQAGVCHSCPQGTYRTKGVHKTCIACPSGITSEGPGAIRREDCNTPSCEPGQFLVVVNKQCQLCPRATYQDEPMSTSCKLCIQDHTTAALGATHVSQCYSTNQCATGEDDCSWHALCDDLPDDHDVPSFVCHCKPGYRGNGTHCQDACTNFCLNDGICQKNPVGYVQCVCKDNFSGERCQVRFQPKTQKVAYITGGIGGVVAILIIIVIVIWMISFRFNSKRSLNGDVVESKLSPALALTNDDLNEANFMYGRATVPTPGTRSIGYYYEDDDDYDMKTMYINDGCDGVGDKLSTTESMPQNSKEEMFERLRRMNQHMYRPKQNSDGEQSDRGDEEARISH